MDILNCHPFPTYCNPGGGGGEACHWYLHKIKADRNIEESVVSGNAVSVRAFLGVKPTKS